MLVSRHLSLRGFVVNLREMVVVVVQRVMIRMIMITKIKTIINGQRWEQTGRQKQRRCAGKQISGWKTGSINECASINESINSHQDEARMDEHEDEEEHDDDGDGEGK